ncbi:hypothetical protein COU62_00195 [Candidatus Pacearchaeota archaeon CG10_big_fil_rev_8_21_14_0_10_35_219]|nr:stage II sporulation protein M [Candidatus Pacearchaeota archaeon]OIO41831.1 MAG: hypothetical protein AUJ63_04715 [Candidatus Pacearchaeota archaeon CG1_02_35_32]PIO08495.1 MAG: hypothetical protein COU62_00195 [Candidatus Pacearchaeota archaeon CG10_big_fil_rev_8_21_14_0_10_35_219]PIY81798.1 MAG: hypothetical protein COY79_00655 [Candidatus Pacearchaeota archaeon CG_4_10_14_0_8_um_filter_35_169]PIZ80085.1 MAG: hypothetical protein COY00_02340 [Candidatus Pacearchaeota archaeon CG_4_10_14_0
MRKKQRTRINRKRSNWFKDSWDYIKESKNYIYSAIFLFLAGGLVGFIFQGYFENYLLEIIRDLVDKTEGLSTEGLILFIFWNNLGSAFISILSGMLLGIVPVMSILVNGVLLGFVMNKAIAVEGIFTFWRLAPHGIFELPAIFIAVGLGIKFGTFWFSGKNIKKEFYRRLRSSLKVFLTIILPLLIVAAIIEGLLIGLG